VRLRSRLVLAFAYVLITVIVALTIPLAVNLRARVTTELESSALSQAQTIAASVGREGLDKQITPRADLDREIDQFAATIPAGRVVVVGADGTVVADSCRPACGTADPNAESDLHDDFLNRPEVQAALDATNPRPYADIRQSDELGQPVLVAAAPILDDTPIGGTATPIGAVRVSQDISEVKTNERNVTVGLLIVGLTGLLAGLVIAFALAGSLAAPLQRLATAAHRLGSGDLTARAGDVTGASEITDLAHSFDEMAERLERTVQAQREFVANASHQLRTPLTGMKLRLEAAANESDDPEVKRQLEAADKEVDRLAETVNRLLVMAREVEEGLVHRSHATDLRAAADRAAERWSERAGRLLASVQTHGETAEAAIDPTDLDQILDNLLDNAVAYAPGVIEVETGATYVAVRDHGPGIAPDEQSRVTERFYRGRGAPSGGSGLGLAIVRELAERWGGAVAISSPEDGGTRVEVTLPAVS
jgi:signal transduction histidine kinase